MWMERRSVSGIGSTHSFSQNSGEIMGLPGPFHLNDFRAALYDSDPVFARPARSVGCYTENLSKNTNNPTSALNRGIEFGLAS